MKSHLVLYIFAIYIMELLKQCTGFDWGEGNQDKNWILHQVSQSECEQVFFNEPIIVTNDKAHSIIEKRWYLLGQTNAKRMLFVVFTVRDKKIRVISARDMSKRERSLYNDL
ncbi:MAG: BrnT family toxin [Bacteroidales bacterium]|nr:BrnT family toxin [Bacteroidales bacterium]